MYIGEVSKLTGASAKAIRLYESLGLLGTVVRKGSYRIYDDNHVRTVTLIKGAKSIGVSLAEFKRLLGDKNALSCDVVSTFLDQKSRAIEEQINQFHRQQTMIQIY
ncbi:transcriptional regulator [Photobacterium sp. GB-50]|uniref:MerR family transcriptional regulator n=1 Tax=Photobacterium sp. GB-50 TaxID=2022107 RepID=UPI000D17B72C|nr:MerR family transcriptional regulator [Photobacterium sp. GB-50]PSW73589.1 transcriptional regulator [Photobacterium sp. GB-50]